MTLKREKSLRKWLLLSKRTVITSYFIHNTFLQHSIKKMKKYLMGPYIYSTIYDTVKYTNTLYNVPRNKEELEIIPHILRYYLFDWKLAFLYFQKNVNKQFLKRQNVEAIFTAHESKEPGLTVCNMMSNFDSWCIYLR